MTLLIPFRFSMAAEQKGGQGFALQNG